ncbi:MAG: hypothetical protein HYV17_07675 [Xanthomonadales bacterium]|nr:hypothetical protein [Xanthomonadales bacterium]
MKQCLRFGILVVAAGGAQAAEVTVKNDSLADLGTAVIVQGFVPGEKAASWLTSPCNGDLRAVQVFWRSPAGTSGQTLHQAIEISRSGTFPTPGTLAQSIVGPVLTDGALNEFRYLDENNTVPLIVPVTANETFVVALEFDVSIGAGDPSVVRDVDGNQSGRNGLYAQIGAGSYAWFNSSSLGVNGDWVIRAVIDCAVVPQQADVGVGIATSPLQYTAGQPLSYTIVVDNAGPAASATTTIVDLFPAAYLSPMWTCAASSGASCPASGSGNIATNVVLPVGGQVTFSVNGTVAAGTTGTLVNSVTAVVGGGITDPVGGNNTATANTGAATSVLLFLDGFEG